MSDYCAHEDGKVVTDCVSACCGHPDWSSSAYWAEAICVELSVAACSCPELGLCHWPGG